MDILVGSNWCIYLLWDGLKKMYTYLLLSYCVNQWVLHYWFVKFYSPASIWKPIIRYARVYFTSSENLKDGPEITMNTSHNSTKCINIRTWHNSKSRIMKQLNAHGSWWNRVTAWMIVVIVAMMMWNRIVQKGYKNILRYSGLLSVLFAPAIWCTCSGCNVRRTPTARMPCPR